MRFRWADSLISCGRKVDFKNFRIRVDGTLVSNKFPFIFARKHDHFLTGQSNETLKKGFFASG